MSSSSALHLRLLGEVPYEAAWIAMKNYTDSRDEQSPDEIWCLQHPPVFTQGQAGKAEHVLMAGDIPVVESDRGGQVTYHGPGQLVMYLMLDLKRHGLGVRKLVDLIEHSIVELLDDYGFKAWADPDAPGVYVKTATSEKAKIAALGLRVRHGRSFHGLSFNIDMDLEPFSRINPCGYQGLAVTSLSELCKQRLQQGRPVAESSVSSVTTAKAAEQLVEKIQSALGYNQASIFHELP